MNHYKIAIVGATGNVGQTLLQLLAKENFPAENLTLLASERSVGKRIRYQEQMLIVEDLASFDFNKVQLAFFAAGSEVAEFYAPKAVNAGCYVIDKSSHFRLNPEIPLIVPEVNGDVLQKNKSKIIAVPNCSTIQLVMALKPLHDLAEISRVEVATYQAVSGAGKKGILQLQQELEHSHEKSAAIPIAFNAVPVIDKILTSGFTKEEMKLHDETQKILNANFVVNATAVRIPVWQGHSEAVHLTCKKEINLAEAKQALQNFPGIRYCEEEIPTALTHAANDKAVWIGRLRRHEQDSAHHLNFWLVADNLYKGAAWNALQIAMKLLSF